MSESESETSAWLAPSTPSGAPADVGQARLARALAALGPLFDETTRLFHRISAVMEEVHGQGERSAGRRSLLRELYAGPPKTVPQMARERPVSRQYIQMLVNQLAGEGLMEFVENAAHKRSHLVRLTAKGRATVEAMDAHEATVFAQLEPPHISEERLLVAVATLREVRAWVEREERRLSRRSRAPDEDDE